MFQNEKKIKLKIKRKTNLTLLDILKLHTSNLGGGGTGIERIHFSKLDNTQD